MRNWLFRGVQFFLLVALIAIPGLLSFDGNSQGVNWNTFMGSAEWDECKSITLDGSGNVYITGTSQANWALLSIPMWGGKMLFLLSLFRELQIPTSMRSSKISYLLTDRQLTLELNRPA